MAPLSSRLLELAPLSPLSGRPGASNPSSFQAERDDPLSGRLSGDDADLLISGTQQETEYLAKISYTLYFLSKVRKTVEISYAKE